MRGGKDEDTSNENLPSMGDGERGYCHSNAVTQPHKRSNTKTAQNTNGVRQGGSTVGVALSCISITFFLVKGTAPAKKKLICAEMMINTQADFELCLFSEEEEDGENRILAVSRMSL